MSSGEPVLLAATIAIAFVHTILGPDHYLPFVAIGRARRWSRTKLLVITAACGTGHVLSSVALGLAGAALGFTVTRFEAIEALRGSIAAWGLIAFGLLYMVWGIRAAARGRVHSHAHAHAGGDVHLHEHDHREEHLHPHASGRSATPWVLFTIFLLGPCEPLIPLLMLPAMRGEWATVWMVTGVFSAVTLATMLGAVLALELGARRLAFGGIARWGHAIAGGTILACGVAIQFLGL
jgi:sulfite exporter TauE/SafE